MEMTPIMFSRERAMSAQAANTMTAASCRFSEASVPRSPMESASRKKQTAPAASTASTTAGMRSSSGSSPAARPPKSPVAAMTEAVSSGMNQSRALAFVSIKMKPAVNMSTQAAA